VPNSRPGVTRMRIEPPAWRLCPGAGFTVCGPLADDTPDPSSVFMTLELQSAA